MEVLDSKNTHIAFVVQATNGIEVVTLPCTISFLGKINRGNIMTVNNCNCQVINTYIEFVRSPS